MQAFKFDTATGFYVSDVIHPDTILVSGLPDADGNLTMHETPYPLAADETAVKPPDGLWHPKWDGSTWVEGLTAAEIETRQPKYPDWTVLIKAISDNTNPLKALLTSTTDQLALVSAAAELHRDQPRFELIKLHWDNVIAGLPVALTKAQRDLITALGTEANLGLSLDAKGKLIEG